MITQPVTIITHGIVAVAAAAGAWAYQGHRYDAQLSEVQLSYSKRDFKALEAQYADTIRLQKKAEDAQAKAAVRIRTLAADRDILRGAVERLRGDLTASGNAATDTGATTTDNAAAARVVSAECADALATMAGHADGWRSEAMTLREAWPR
jgi:hypothetical protein